MSTPQWDIFRRIEDLEDLYLDQAGKVEAVEPTLKDISAQVSDATIMSRYGLLVSFVVGSIDRDPREGKTVVIDFLKDAGLSDKQLESLNLSLSALCEMIEDQPG